MTDYVLIIVAGAAMLFQSIMGLLVTTRTPPPQRKFLYEMAFCAIGFVGGVAVVWSGVRTADTSNYIKYGVAHIEQLDVASGELLKQQMDIMVAQRSLLSKEIESHATPKKLAANAVFKAAPSAQILKQASPSQAKSESTPNTEAASLFENIKKIDADYAAQRAKDKILSDCIIDRKIPVYTGLLKLINQAVNYQNGWAYSRNGEQLQQQYLTWTGAVHQFFVEHRNELNNTEEFDQIKELDMRPTLFFISSGGENAWQNFDAKRKSLIKIEEAYNKSACSAEEEADKTK